MLYVGGKEKEMSVKRGENENFEKHMSQGSLSPKNRFLGQKAYSVACSHTRTYTHGNENRGHAFRVSGAVQQQKINL